MSNFDLANLALQAICPGNELLYDDKGMPSVMVKIPKMSWADLGIGTSTAAFPAFVINGTEVDAIYFSKYQNVVQNSRAYSLPGQDPKTAINYDTAMTYSANKGEGYHCVTRLEWMTLALWCLKNGYQPKGNNNYGRDHSETVYKAIPSCARDANGRIQRVATGTGPVSWSHNNAPDGVWDLNGNVLEWTTGIRTVYGELQVISHDGETFGNDAADPDNSQSAASSCWYAIDGTTGGLITPDGNGTTPKSLKADFVNGAIKWITGTLSDKADKQRSCPFANITADTNVCEAAQHILMALGFLKPNSEGPYNSDYVYINNGLAERSFFCGGNWTYTSNAGVFFARGSSARSYASSTLGFRSAFVKLPTA